MKAKDGRKSSKEKIDRLDEEIVEFCHTYFVLTPEHLMWLLRDYGISSSTLKRRLLKLYRLEVLDRFRPFKPPGQGTNPNVYRLGKEGCRLLRTLNPDLDVPKRWKRKPRPLYPIHLRHTLEVNMLLARLCANQPDEDDVARWFLYPVKVGRRAAEKVSLVERPEDPDIAFNLRPDALIGLSLCNCNMEEVLLCLELDCATERLSVLRGKIERFWASFYSDQWFMCSGDFPLVLFVVTGYERLKNVIKIARRVLSSDILRVKTNEGWWQVDYEQADPDLFHIYFTTKELVDQAHSLLLSEIWLSLEDDRLHSLDDLLFERIEERENYEKQHCHTTTKR